MSQICQACKGTQRMPVSITGGRFKRRCTLCKDVPSQPINRKNDYSKTIEAAKMAGHFVMWFIAGMGAVLYILLLVAGGIQSSNGRRQVSRHNRRSFL
jgi:hypothetical protein